MECDAAGGEPVAVSFPAQFCYVDLGHYRMEDSPIGQKWQVIAETVERVIRVLFYSIHRWRIEVVVLSDSERTTTTRNLSHSASRHGNLILKNIVLLDVNYLTCVSNLSGVFHTVHKSISQAKS
jgi:hypothetical protein